MKSSLDSLFNPQAIAIVGASASEEKAGGMVLKLLENYPGKVYPVNPKAEVIAGHKAFPSLDAIGENIDLVLLAVPAKACPGVLKEAANVGAKAAAIMSGGFGESGEEGQTLQDELAAVCAETGIRLLGPNTAGYSVPANNVISSFAPPFSSFKTGDVAVVSQSGGLSITLACMLQQDGCGVSVCIGLGNSVDIDAADVIDYLINNEKTKVVALYLEGLSDGRRIVEAVERISEHKPVVALTIGRNDIGEFAQSHTGKLVGSYELKVAALKQAGAVVVENSNDLVDAVFALSMMRLPPLKDPGIGVLIGQAGPGLLMLEQLKSSGVSVPELNQSTIDKISNILPPMTFIRNPVDTARPSPEFRDVLLAMDEDDKLDAILVYALHEPATLRPVEMFEEINPKRTKPVIYGTMGPADIIKDTTEQLATKQVAPFKSPERAAKAMCAVVEDAKIRYRKQQYKSANPISIGSLPQGALDEASAKTYLKEIKIAVPNFKACESQDEALAAFNAMEKPVAVKVLNADIQHKTEVGGVHLKINSESELIEALTKIDAIPYDGKLNYLVEEMASSGVDLIVGGLRDNVFGPAVLLGMGGTAAEALKDVSMRLAPLQAADVEEMLSELKTGELLDGWRGSPAVNKQAIIDTVLAVANLLVCEESVSELDINPLRATASGAVALDALIVKKDL